MNTMRCPLKQSRQSLCLFVSTRATWNLLCNGRKGIARERHQTLQFDEVGTQPCASAWPLNDHPLERKIFWSALTSQRFGRSRPVAGMVHMIPGTGLERQAAQGQSGDRRGPRRGSRAGVLTSTALQSWTNA
jgi:hypothetical protein